ncbi:unnamed protein product [Protopolystoma xenopodis]|uniref:Innexin n=1 Tax=Protopolystoma xenopodis TaxID=117903 RepID=A0A448XDW6_9PLAT|nr:unnamed protein product [Protopolystoma xenopodis]
MIRYLNSAHAIVDTDFPMQCWIPQEFTRSWEEYAENYCWIETTYFSPLDKQLHISTPGESRTHIVRYYQWATIVLGIQAAAFYFPCFIWRLFQDSGLLT